MFKSFIFSCIIISGLSPLISQAAETASTTSPVNQVLLCRPLQVDESPTSANLQLDYDWSWSASNLYAFQMTGANLDVNNVAAGSSPCVDSELSTPPSVQTYLYDPYRINIYPHVNRNAVMLYYARMTETDVIPIMRFHWDWNHTSLYGVDFTHDLDPHNIVSRFFALAWLTTQINAIAVYQNDPNGPIYELNPYLSVRWWHFPWSRYVKTSIGFGEGVSFASGHSARETRSSSKAKNDRDMLNYLMFELTASLAAYPKWELVYRIHHRSGVFGLYCPGLVGSTAVGIGIRYRF